MKSALKAFLLSASVLLPAQVLAETGTLEQQTAIWLEHIRAPSPEAAAFYQKQSELYRTSFTAYPGAVLGPLQELAAHFSAPGEAIPYGDCMIEGQQKKAFLNTPAGQEEFKQMLAVAPPQLHSLVKKMAEKSTSITLGEQVSACRCANEHTWNSVLTADHRAVYNKMVQGISLDQSERKTLTTEASSFTPLSSGYDPMECGLKAIGLYDEYLKIQGY
ncbi:hypothetical protein [Kiloniella laminariae]|uniref:hypothetical protein n=1 Tax=Kiloniella laminariae TaxID=454162 RepID=UPI00035E4046|nr:hypothetical protein [Kiloniella laminariae]